MRFIRIIAFSIIGLYLVVGIRDFFEAGYLQRWEKLSPTQQEEINKYFSAKNEQRFSENAKIKKPCDYSQPEFSFLSNSPKNITDCVHFTEMYAEGVKKYTFVRDSKGNIWEWSFLYILNWNSLICFPAIGLFGGASIANWTEKSNKVYKINQPASL